MMLENAVLSAQRQLELAKNLMRMLLGINAQTEVVLTDDLFTLLTGADIEKTLNTAYDAQANLDFQLMMLQKDLAKKKLNMGKNKVFANGCRFLQLH
jgi:outer membrane protein